MPPLDKYEEYAVLERTYRTSLRRFRAVLWVMLAITYSGATFFTILSVLPLLLVDTDFFATSPRWFLMPRWAWMWLGHAIGAVGCGCSVVYLGRIQEDILRREEEERHAHVPREEVG